LNPMQYNQYGQQWPQPLALGIHNYKATAQLAPQVWELHGAWDATKEAITPVDGVADISGGFQAQHVYLVMTSTGNTPRTGRVNLDGKPIPVADDGADVKPGGTFTVTGERLYSLVNLPADQLHAITVELPPGISAYDFTFG
jgi:hypothetical protein